MILYSYCNILYIPLSIYNCNIDCEVFVVGNEPLKIKRKYDDGNRVISIRIREELLEQLDTLANTSNRSRNEIINLILEHGVKNIEIE